MAARDGAETAGRSEAKRHPAAGGPVEIVPEADEPRPRARRSGVIEITFGSGARACVRGEVSPETLRQVIELLR
jgi:hypothetical protein